MNRQIQTVVHGKIDQSVEVRIQTWASQVLARVDPSRLPLDLCVNIWANIEELAAFYRQEKEALGVVTGEETDFLATHEAWRGHPRIHICEERVRHVSLDVVQGALHHEIGHALHHGSPEFYTFRFSGTLQEAGRSCGLDLPLLQQCIYLLSIAIKDNDVVKWLAKVGFGFSQLALFRYLMSDTEEERQVWEVASNSAALRKITMAAFLKVLSPVETMIAVGMKDAPALKEQWKTAYQWLPKKECDQLCQFTKRTFEHDNKGFQDRLEKVALELITLPDL
ncbi:MAG: hypothetical protein V1689_06860 [Pseudomonadota bacterium]